MKKFLFFLVLTIFGFVLFSQGNNFETITKLRTEQELAERLEELLKPIVGKTIVIVDLKLQYPKLDFSETTPTSEKGDKLSISRKRAAIVSRKKRKELETTLETKVISKRITIYVKKNIDYEMENIVRSSVKEWLKIDVGKGDRITMKKVLPETEVPAKAAKNKISKNATSTTVANVSPFLDKQFLIFSIFGILLLILIIILSANFRKGTEALSSSLKEVGDNMQSISGGTIPQLSAGNKSSESSILEESHRKPLQIKILPPQEQKAEETDFSFLENLSPESFGEFIANEKADDIAFIYSAVSVDFLKSYLDKFPENFDRITKAFASHPKKTKAEIAAFRKKLFDKYNEFLKNEKIEIDGVQLLANLFNNLPYDKSGEFFDNLKTSDIDLAAELKDKIFLLDDIIKLDDKLIKGIIFNFSQQQLALFLKSVEDDIREKFFRNLSSRAQEIYKAELENLPELSAEEKSEAIDNTLQTIRSILNYI